jgi:hypothetical protein
LGLTARNGSRDRSRRRHGDGNGNSHGRRHGDQGELLLHDRELFLLLGQQLALLLELLLHLKDGTVVDLTEGSTASQNQKSVSQE